MSDKINGIALSTNTNEDTLDYGMVTDPATGCPIIFQLSDNPCLPKTKQLVLSHYIIGKSKVTITFLIAENRARALRM